MRKQIKSANKNQDPVEVFCRIRSLSNPSGASCIALYSPTEIEFTPGVQKDRKVLHYTFSHIFTENADQKEIFDYVAMPLLSALVKGENGLLFSYGVTGSGKTYTMSGEKSNPGIIPRCINTLFNSISNCQTVKYLIKSDKLNGFEIQADNGALMERLQEAKMKRKMSKKQDNAVMEQVGDACNSPYLNEGEKIVDFDANFMCAVFITYIEIYNNSAYDLLDENAGIHSFQPKILREDSHRIIYVNNVAEIEVKSAQEALDLYLLGNKRKRMGTTSLNVDSSRSHSIFNIRLVILPQDYSEATNKNSLIISQLSLVDLAGTERCNRANTIGAALKEAGCINSSLMSLRNCLNILRENQQTGQHRIIPYRDTRLTHLFKSYFEGEGKVKMIVCVNPSIRDFEETIHVLQFAEITQEVKIPRPETKLIEKVDERQEIIRVIDEIKITKEHLKNSRIPVPKATSIDPDNKEIRTLILYLKQRREILATASIIRSLGNTFKTRLIEIQNFQDKYNQEVKFLLPAERAKVKELKHKLIKSNVLLEETVEQCMEREEKIRELKKKVAEQDFQLRQNMVNKEKYQQKIDKISEKITHELDFNLRRQRAHYDVLMKKQSEKIELVKGILTSDKIPDNVCKTQHNISKTSTEVSRVPPDVSEHLSNVLSHKLRKVSSEVSIVTSNEYNENVHPIPSKEFSASQGRVSIGHVPRRKIPVSNPRYRRARSAGDVWLQHKPAQPVPLGTVLQPVIRTRKSLSKLTAMKEITNTKQSKYLLISQGADDDGGLKTELYKGDIIPTCSGGAQVIFDDVEKLVQESLSQSNVINNVHRR